MALFNREGKTTIKEYITTTDSVSRPTAILLTAIVFILAAAVAFTLFWAGRWTYNRLTNNNEGTITQTSSQRTGEPATAPGASTTPSSTPKKTSGSQSGASSTASSNNAATRTPSTIPSNPSGEVPNTGPGEIPNTGPQAE
jgi:cytoskeletal protein RodZ